MTHGAWSVRYAKPFQGSTDEGDEKAGVCTYYKDQDVLCAMIFQIVTETAVCHAGHITSTRTLDVAA